jgi:hypothetical protein
MPDSARLVVSSMIISGDEVVKNSKFRSGDFDAWRDVTIHVAKY